MCRKKKLIIHNRAHNKVLMLMLSLNALPTRSSGDAISWYPRGKMLRWSKLNALQG